MGYYSLPSLYCRQQPGSSVFLRCSRPAAAVRPAPIRLRPRESESGHPTAKRAVGIQRSSRPLSGFMTARETFTKPSGPDTRAIFDTSPTRWPCTCLCAAAMPQSVARKAPARARKAKMGRATNGKVHRGARPKHGDKLAAAVLARYSNCRLAAARLQQSASRVHVPCATNGKVWPGVRTQVPGGNLF